MIRLQIHHAYTCWEHYTFCASKQQDFCLFIDSVKSLTYTGHSKCQNDQYKDIGNQLSTTGDPRAQVIQRLWACLVYKCSLSTRINKTNGFNRPFDGHRGCQLHIFERSICHKQSSRTRSQTIIQGQETTWFSWPLNCAFWPCHHPLQLDTCGVKTSW